MVVHKHDQFVIAASILVASVVAVWLGWRYEETRRMDREAAIRIAEINQDRETARGTSEREGKLERAKLKHEAALALARLSLPGSVAPSVTKSEIELPDDLEAHVLSWNDEWARDDQRDVFRRSYLELHTGNADETWQKVRRAAGVAEMP